MVWGQRGRGGRVGSGGVNRVRMVGVKRWGQWDQGWEWVKGWGGGVKGWGSQGVVGVKGRCGRDQEVVGSRGWDDGRW